MEARKTIIESPALALGPLTITEKPHRGSRRMRGTVFKRVLVSHLWWLLQNLPEHALRAYLGLGFASAHGVSRAPGNPLLESCELVTRLAARYGHHHEAAGVCRAFLDGYRTILGHTLTLYRRGPEQVLGEIRTDPPGLLATVRREHGAAIVCVPHNPGAIFAATRVNLEVPLTLVMRNPRSIERTRIALAMFERMGVSVIMARDVSPFAMTRAFLRILRQGRVLVATVDRMALDETRVVRPFFGTPVGWNPWAARVAVRARVPMVPGYVTTDRGGVVLHLGTPFVPDDVEEAIERYLLHFEAWIAAEPSAWSFLADRRWRWVMKDAVRGRSDSDGGRVDPDRRTR